MADPVFVTFAFQFISLSPSRIDADVLCKHRLHLINFHFDEGSDKDCRFYTKDSVDGRIPSTHAYNSRSAESKYCKSLSSKKLGSTNTLRGHTGEFIVKDKRMIREDLSRGIDDTKPSGMKSLLAKK